MSTNSHQYRSRLADIAVVVVIFFGVAGIAFWQFATSFAEQGANSGGPFDNAAMFPRLIAWTLIILGVVQVATSLLSKGTGAGDGRSEPAAAQGQDDGRLLLRALACLATFILYLSVVTTVGYITATIVMLLVMFVILGARPIVAAVVAVAATFVAGLIFGTLLNVVLPVGRLGLPTVF